MHSEGECHQFSVIKTTVISVKCANVNSITKIILALFLHESACINHFQEHLSSSTDYKYLNLEPNSLL